MVVQGARAEERGKMKRASESEIIYIRSHFFKRLKPSLCLCVLMKVRLARQ